MCMIILGVLSIGQLTSIILENPVREKVKIVQQYHPEKARWLVRSSY